MRGTLRRSVLAILLSLASAAGATGQVWEVDDVYLVATSPDADSDFGAAVALGDLDSDGDLDLIVGQPGDRITVYLDIGSVPVYRNLGDRTFALWAEFGGSGSGGERRGAAVASGDFDADGRFEVVYGEPGQAVFYNSTVIEGAGRVFVREFVSGSTWAETASLSEILTAPTQTPETGDGFGSTLAVGDFDGDGADDLAVGAPYEDLGTNVDTGMVHVFYGSVIGLRSDNPQSFSPGLNGMSGTQASGNRFGFSLATGDFDDDGYDDLAIGAPYRSVAAVAGAGQVHVLYGSASGLTLSGQALLDETSYGESLGTSERFGYSLAAANYDEGGILCILSSCYDDLAIGVPGQSVSGQAAAGKVLIAYGAAAGLPTSSGSYTNLSQNSVATAGPEAGDEFGESLAAGRLDRPPSVFWADDLAVGTPDEKIGDGPAEEGFVQLFFGNGLGVDAGAQEQTFGQRPGFGIAPSIAFDGFGQALAIGDLDGDGWGDLVVGVPHKTVGGLTARGAVQILFGALFADGFNSGGSASWTVP